MEIQPLLITDTAEIIALQERAGYEDGWNYEMTKQAFSFGKYLCFGYKENGRISGFIGVNDNLFSYDITALLVDVDLRRKGIGEKLILFAEKKIKETNGKKTEIFLEVRKGNLPAFSLYKKLGYKTVSERKKYYPDGEDAVVMKKEL